MSLATPPVSFVSPAGDGLSCLPLRLHLRCRKQLLIYFVIVARNHTDVTTICTQINKTIIRVISPIRYQKTI